MDLIKRLKPYLLAVPIILTSCSKKESATEPIVNHSPIIERIIASDTEPLTNQEISLECRAIDEDEEDINNLKYEWTSSNGELRNRYDKIARWISPSDTGEYTISIKVDDSQGKRATKEIEINVFSRFDTVYVSEDAYVSEYNPNWNSQNSEYDYRFLQISGGEYLGYPFLNFKFAEEGNNKKIKSAKLILNVATKSIPLTNIEFYIHKVLEPWNEETINYSNQPRFEEIPKSFSPQEIPDDYWDDIYIEMNTLAQEWKDDTQKNYGFLILPSQRMDGSLGFSSKENPGLKIPKIALEYE